METDIFNFVAPPAAFVHPVQNHVGYRRFALNGFATGFSVQRSSECIDGHAGSPGGFFATGPQFSPAAMTHATPLGIV